jgi:CRISPR/Cas system CSM-associated protein Csm3 (group 7 of RAMP superfamily)
MCAIDFTLTLNSDAELGSGLGNELVNDIIARDHLGKPVLRASHLKGLLRATLEEIGSNRGWNGDLAEWCFGRPGAAGDDGAPGAVSFRDARPVGEAVVRTITRTSLTELGVVHGQTLRTTEAIAAGTAFHGEVRISADVPPAVDLAVRLALLAVEAVGGGRTRGGGACHVTIAREQRSPSQILRALDATAAIGPARGAELVQRRPATNGPEAATWLRVVFRARDPICCPEAPGVSSNIIRSGLGIPASAVQGALITRLAAQRSDLADRTLADIRTRFWPLLPCGQNDGAGAPPVPVRVALSHRMSKLPTDTDGTYAFRDAAVEPYDWRLVARGVPMKGGDGILLRKENGRVALWRSGDVPRVVTAHAVHHDPTGQDLRNLFTVEALAPDIFAGLVCLPPEAAGRLAQSLSADPEVCFGKARTVRGGGTLDATPIPGDRLPGLWAGWQERVFVLQSPAAIPDDWDVANSSAEALLARLVRDSGWGEIADVGRQRGQVAVTTLAASGVRFGWNRHGVGKLVGGTRRLRARRVFLPGSVFLLDRPPVDLPGLLLRGLGVGVGQDVDGREQGFGAVLPHPGIASSRHRLARETSTIRSRSEAGKLALGWWRKAGSPGPSASQIAAVRERIRGADGNDAAEYLERQRTGRAKRVWERWELVHADVLNRIRRSPGLAHEALRTWQDLVIANPKEEG